jgi:hypothetical protein
MCRRFDAERASCCALESRERTGESGLRVKSLTLQKSRGKPTSRRARK